MFLYTRMDKTSLILEVVYLFLCVQVLTGTGTSEKLFRKLDEVRVSQDCQVVARSLLDCSQKCSKQPDCCGVTYARTGRLCCMIDVGTLASITVTLHGAANIYLNDRCTRIFQEMTTTTATTPTTGSITSPGQTTPRTRTDATTVTSQTTSVTSTTTPTTGSITSPGQTTPRTDATTVTSQTTSHTSTTTPTTVSITSPGQTTSRTKTDATTVTSQTTSRTSTTTPTTGSITSPGQTTSRTKTGATTVTSQTTSRTSTRTPTTGSITSPGQTTSRTKTDATTVTSQTTSRTSTTTPTTTSEYTTSTRTTSSTTTASTSCDPHAFVCTPKQLLVITSDSVLQYTDYTSLTSSPVSRQSIARVFPQVQGTIVAAYTDTAQSEIYVITDTSVQTYSMETFLFQRETTINNHFGVSITGTIDAAIQYDPATMYLFFNEVLQVVSTDGTVSQRALDNNGNTNPYRCNNHAERPLNIAAACAVDSDLHVFLTNNGQVHTFSFSEGRWYNIGSLVCQ